MRDISETGDLSRLLTRPYYSFAAILLSRFFLNLRSLADAASEVPSSPSDIIFSIQQSIGGSAEFRDAGSKDETNEARDVAGGTSYPDPPDVALLSVY